MNEEHAELEGRLEKSEREKKTIWQTLVSARQELDRLQQEMTKVAATFNILRPKLSGLSFHSCLFRCRRSILHGMRSPSCRQNGSKAAISSEGF